MKQKEIESPFHLDGMHLPEWQRGKIFSHHYKVPQQTLNFIPPIGMEWFAVM
jgi:hypothetical protein